MTSPSITSPAPPDQLFARNALPVGGHDACTGLPCLQTDCRIARLATMYLSSDGHYVSPRQHSVARGLAAYLIDRKGLTVEMASDPSGGFDEEAYLSAN